MKKIPGTLFRFTRPSGAFVWKPENLNYGNGLHKGSWIAISQNEPLMYLKNQAFKLGSKSTLYETYLYKENIVIMDVANHEDFFEILKED